MYLIKQKGTAIIIALFVVGLVAMIAITMMARLNRDIQRTELLLNSTQAELYAQGSTAWAKDTLRDNWLNQKVHAPIDALPLSSAVSHIENYSISSTLYDAQSHFNLNNLTDPGCALMFQRLLLTVEPRLNAETAQKIIAAIADWIAPQAKSGDLAMYYAKLPQPYKAPHRIMTSVSELRLVRGMTADLYTKLLPYVTALPEATLINVNTAPIPALKSLSPTLTDEAAKAITLYRLSSLFGSLDQFLGLDTVRNNSFSENRITINSQYFLLETKVSKGKQQLALYTMLQRTLHNGKPNISVIWQSKGGI